jgi:hypothetical protein
MAYARIADKKDVMCVFCTAIPTAAVAGLTLDQKYKKTHPQVGLQIRKKPFLVLTVFIILIFISLSLLVHSRQ